MLDISEGNLFIRDIDSTTAPARLHRSQLNAIPQEPYFFPGSFRENLTRGDDVTEDRMWQVLRKIELERKIIDLGGLDQPLTPETFSAGELQLLSLARAVLHPKGILLLDEATSK